MKSLNKHEKTLELPKILQMLAAEASFSDAKDLALSLAPAYSLDAANARLQETADAHSLVGRFGAPSFGKIENVQRFLKRAESGGLLLMGELLKIGEALRVFRSLKEWKARSAGISTSLDEKFSGIYENKYFEDKIAASILSDDEMADTASPELANIRRKIRAASAKVREQLDKIIRSQTYQKYLQDAIVTIRDGRFVVPVKAEYRAEVHGLVHDTSASGATVFIEPMSVVETNNEIKVLHARENAEIERILSELSQEAGAFSQAIISSYNVATELCVIFAKARLAYKMKAAVPQMNDSGVIYLKKARHPLLPKEKIVPIDIMLGGAFDTLVITGPNTGGKTVSLKTVGLFSLMAMCGLMIPASEESRLSVFENILADIGDEQSIEQSLSTFSSHMVNIINITQEVSANSLILLDELGAGTDPVEGAALATAILEHLREKGAKIVATTHYPELKTYALKTPRVENACCEFDLKTLCPTYRLLIGVAGKSNAFAISEKLGIPGEIVERAKALVSDEQNQLESVMQLLEGKRQALEAEGKRAAQLKSEAERLRRSAQEQQQKIEDAAEKELENAKLSAQRLLDKARRQANSFFDEIEALRKEKRELTTDEKAKLKAKLRDLEETSDPVAARREEAYSLPRSLQVGDSVLLFDINKNGTVLETADSSGNVLVQIGAIKMRTPAGNLRLLAENTAKKQVGKTTRNVASKAQRSVCTELDLRGQTALEAIIELDRFIDSALMSGISQITVIHGKGTGVLRKEVQAHLKRHPSVKSYRLGVFGEGETGVTIAELK